jgi:hypothetical protein
MGQDKQEKATGGSGEAAAGAARVPRPLFARLGSLAGPWLLFWALAAGLQLASGTFGSDFGGHSDEAAHYVTGLMMHDYLVGLDWGQPLRFAENYYRHYPKVALGHWPPFFYLVQAAWTIPFGTSRVSVLLLMAAVTALLALTVYRSVRAEFGPFLGWAMGVLCLTLPWIQLYTSILMADILTTLLCFWATLCFGRFLETGGWRTAAAFGVLPSLAILTKGSGLLLGVMVPLAVVLAGRYRLLLRPAFWLPAAVVLALCVPWMYLTRHLAGNYGWDYTWPTLDFTVPALGFFGWELLQTTGFGLLALVGLGLFVKLVRPGAAGVTGKWAACGALLPAVGIFHCVLPVGLEQRFLIPALPPALLFLAAGLAWLAARVPGRWPAGRKEVLVTAALVLVFAVETFTVRTVSFLGFGEAARALARTPDGPERLLISSDPSGEGAFVAAVAGGERRPGHVVLRASKVLATDDWLGRDYAIRPDCRTPEAMQRHLERLGVGVVVLDTSAPLTPWMGHHLLLGATIAAYPGRWQELSVHDVRRGSGEHPEALHVYRLLGRASEPQ